MLIVDDHALFRQGLCNVLGLEADIEIVAEASDGEEALKKIAALRPDVVLLDLNLPKLNGMEVVKRVKNKYPDVQVVILTIYEDEYCMLEVIRAGAMGFLLKDIEPAMLIKAIHMVNDGKYVVDPTLTGKFVELIGLSSQPVQLMPHRFQTRSERLTVREMDILRLLMHGLSNQEIAARIYLSEKTIKNHLTSVFRKLAVSDRTQAVLYAIKHKIIEEPVAENVSEF
jgi:DNA-binding NarL/FixJ family response regulator